jgi:hypothetical protein
LLRLHIAHDLGNAFVVEKRRRTVGRDNDRYAGPQNEGFRVIDLKAKSTYQFHRKWPERRSPLKRPQGSFEVFGRHSVPRLEQSRKSPFGGRGSHATSLLYVVTFGNRKVASRDLGNRQ